MIVKNTSMKVIGMMNKILLPDSEERFNDRDCNTPAVECLVKMGMIRLIPEAVPVPAVLENESEPAEEPESAPESEAETEPAFEAAYAPEPEIIKTGARSRRKKAE